MVGWPVYKKDVRHLPKLPFLSQHQHLIATSMASLGPQQLTDPNNGGLQLPRPHIMIRSHNALQGAPFHSLKMIPGASTMT